MSERVHVPLWVLRSSVLTPEGAACVMLMGSRMPLNAAVVPLLSLAGLDGFHSEIKLLPSVMRRRRRKRKALCHFLSSALRQEKMWSFGKRCAFSFTREGVARWRLAGATSASSSLMCGSPLLLSSIMLTDWPKLQLRQDGFRPHCGTS